MANVIALIDGFNMYHALQASVGGIFPYRTYKWIDYRKLAECFAGHNGVVTHVFLFTAYMIGTEAWHRNKRARHARLVAANIAQGVEIVRGRFFARQRTCTLPVPDARIRYSAVEEKRTDVNIAVTLVRLAHERAYDRLLLTTADSDLIPAVEEAKRAYPAGIITSVPPIGRFGTATAVRGVCDRAVKMKISHLAASRLPNVVAVPGKPSVEIECPNTWK